jgi:hypothetical protein
MPLLALVGFLIFLAALVTAITPTLHRLSVIPLSLECYPQYACCLTLAGCHSTCIAYSLWPSELGDNQNHWGTGLACGLLGNYRNTAMGRLDSLDSSALRTQNDSSNVFFACPELP